jgi:Mannose-6-phosphate isomerase
LIGVEGLIVVETEDAVLIVQRDRSQDVKEIVARLVKERAALL